MKLTGKSKLILEEDETVTMKMAKEQEHPAKVAGEKKGKKSRGAAAFELEEEDEKLFEVLRGLRGEIARKEGVPPYIVFSDKSLVHMCVIRPVDKNEMLSVSGVGEFKFENTESSSCSVLPGSTGRTARRMNRTAGRCGFSAGL